MNCLLKTAPRSPVFLENRVNVHFKKLSERWGGYNIVKGSVPSKNKGDVSLISNDYLSLANHKEIINAQIETLSEKGNGMMMSVVFVHENHPQRFLEKSLADFMDAEDGILCQSGYTANVGLVSAIADVNRPVYIDCFAHMSLWDGIACAKAKPIRFRHNDVNHLEQKIKRYGQGIILVDSIYSTLGSVCPLLNVVELGEKYGCVIVVDESHSLGVYGKFGKGLVVERGMADRVHFRTVSLAKDFLRTRRNYCWRRKGNRVP